MQIKLTDKAVKQKNPPAMELWDQALPGFGLRIGAKRRTYFAMARVDGKQVRHRIGTTDEHSLADARELARGWLRNPSSKAMQEAAASAAEQEAQHTKAGTFGAVAQRYLDRPRVKDKTLRTRSQIERRLKTDVPKDWNDRDITSITRAEIRQLFEKKAKASPVSANRLLALLKTIFFYALEQDIIDANPAQRIKPIDETPRDRVLEEHEIRSLWNGLEHDQATIDPLLRVCLRLLLATGVRRSEALFATWDEFNFTPGKEAWRIPGERAKNGHAVVVPLSGAALLLLDEAAEMASPDTDHVFVNRIGQPYAAHSLTQAMRKSLKVCGLADKPAVPHDLRRTFASNIAQLGFSREVLKRLLNHLEGDVTDIYDRHRYDEEARRAMCAWAGRLQELIGKKQPKTNVVSIHGAA